MLVVNSGPALVRTELFPIVDVRVLGVLVPPNKVADATGRVLCVDGHDDLEVGIPSAVADQLDLFAITPKG